MKYLHNKDLVKKAKELRNNMTKEERHLWYDFLKGYTPRFQRQKIIGHYIIDFYCAEVGLVIELDGSQHYEQDGLENDASRTKYLEANDLKIIRILNRDINSDFRNICDSIDAVVRSMLAKKYREKKE